MVVGICIFVCWLVYVLPVMAVGQCRGTCGSQASAGLQQPLHRYGITAMDLLGASGGVVNSLDFLSGIA